MQEVFFFSSCFAGSSWLGCCAVPPILPSERRAKLTTFTVSRTDFYLKLPHWKIYMLNNAENRNTDLHSLAFKSIQFVQFARPQSFTPTLKLTWLSRDWRVSGSSDDFSVIVQLGWNRDQLLNIDSAFELLGRLPQRQALTRIVEEYASIACPDNAPGMER